MKQRVRVLKAMNTLVLSMNDERAYIDWIALVPDWPTEYDFEDIAEDEDYFRDCVTLFRRLWNTYNKSGIYADNCNF